MTLPNQRRLGLVCLALCMGMGYAQNVILWEEVAQVAGE